MEKISVDEMKSIELEIMDEIDRVCREAGIACLPRLWKLLGGGSPRRVHSLG